MEDHCEVGRLADHANQATRKGTNQEKLTTVEWEIHSRCFSHQQCYEEGTREDEL